LAVFLYAETFSQFPGDVENKVTTDDIAECLAYLKIKSDENKKAIDKAKRRGGTRPTPKASSGKGRRR